MGPFENSNGPIRKLKWAHSKIQMRHLRIQMALGPQKGQHLKIQMFRFDFQMLHLKIQIGHFENSNRHIRKSKYGFVEVAVTVPPTSKCPSRLEANQNQHGQRPRKWLWGRHLPPPFQIFFPIVAGDVQTDFCKSENIHVTSVRQSITVTHRLSHCQTVG